MKLALGRARSQIPFLALVLLLAAGPAYYGARAWLAERWNASANPDLWLKAAALEPDDADYWAHLGLSQPWNSGNEGARQAAAYLERATAVNPGSADFWLELADAREALGNPAAARRAYARAQSAAPISPDVAWRYGGFLLRQGSRDSGFAEIRRALAARPSLATLAVSECWQDDPDIAAILDRALPPQRAIYAAAVDYFLSQGQSSAALAAWHRLLGLKTPIEMGQAVPLINSLIDEGRIAAAESTWREALAAAGVKPELPAGESIVYNGGFEREPVDGGFDWREGKYAGLSYALDDRVFHSGRHSMRMDFDRSLNLDFSDLREYVPVAPGERLLFSAYLRTENITTDSGIRFRIYDPLHPDAAEILTPSLVGTHPWTRVTAAIAAGKATDVLVIAIRRIPSQKFDNKLAGAAWVDDVSLVPAHPSAGGHGR